MRSRFLLFGAVFGFILVRVGATRPEAISGMFLLQDLHLAGVIGVAVAATALGFQLLRRTGARSRTGEALAIQPKPMVPGLVAGAALFGVGWAISGTCPGTSVAQIGEGQLAGAVTFAGILAGAWLRGRRVAAGAGEPGGEPSAASQPGAGAA